MSSFYFVWCCPCPSADSETPKRHAACPLLPCPATRQTHCASVVALLTNAHVRSSVGRALVTRLQIVSLCNTFANCFLSSAIYSPLILFSFFLFFFFFFSFFFSFDFFLRSTECSPLTWTTTSWSPCGTTAVPRAERPASRTHISSIPGPPSRTPSSTHTAACQVLTATPRWSTADAEIKVPLLRTQRAPLLYLPWVRILVQIYVLPAMLCLSNF